MTRSTIGPDDVESSVELVVGGVDGQCRLGVRVAEHRALPLAAGDIVANRRGPSERRSAVVGPDGAEARMGGTAGPRGSLDVHADQRSWRGAFRCDDGI